MAFYPVNIEFDPTFIHDDSVLDKIGIATSEYGNTV